MEFDPKTDLFYVMVVLYALSVMMMLADVFESAYEPDAILFYLVTNGVLVFRIIGVYWFTVLAHALTHIFVLMLFLILHGGESATMYYPFLIGIMVLQLALALHYFCLRRGRCPSERALYSGIHAHCGLVVIILMFWHIGYVNNRPPYCGVFMMFYLLFFLSITLTPHFHGVTKRFLKKLWDLKTQLMAQLAAGGGGGSATSVRQGGKPITITTATGETVVVHQKPKKKGGMFKKYRCQEEGDHA